MRNKIIKITIFLFLLFFVALPIIAYAGPLTQPDKINTPMSDLGKNSGFQTTTTNQLPTMIASIIKVFLSLLGIIFIVLLIWAGFNWMTAGGDEEKVNKAKETITRAVIGLVIIVAAYAITVFVFSNLPGGGGTGGGLIGSP